MSEDGKFRLDFQILRQVNSIYKSAKNIQTRVGHFQKNSNHSILIFSTVGERVLSYTSNLFLAAK